jgi:hypothetical protein
MKSRQRTVTFESKLSRISSVSPRWRPCSGEVRISGHGLTKPHCRRLSKAGPPQLGSSARDEDCEKEIKFSLEFYGFDPCGMVRCRTMVSKINSSVCLGILSVMALASVASCGGSGGTAPKGDFMYRGVYSNDYTRGGGTFFVVIDAQQHVNVSFSEPSGTAWFGDGEMGVSVDGTFSATLPDDLTVGGVPLVVTGKPGAMQDGHYTYKISVSSPFTLTDKIATYDGENLGSVFAGTYPCTFNGNESGNVNVVVQPSGQVTFEEPNTPGTPSSGINFLANTKQTFDVKSNNISTRTYIAHFDFSGPLKSVYGTWENSTGKKGAFFGVAQ